jgi:hypothetical protein
MARPLDRRVGLDGSVVETVETPDGLQVVQRDAAGHTTATFRPADDPALPGLAELLDPGRCSGLVGRALGTAVRVTSADLVRYRAGRRATVRLGVDGGPAPVLYAKAFHDRAKAAATARSLAHLGHQLAPSAPLRLPAFAGHDDVPAVVLLGAVDGSPVQLPPPLGPGGPGAADDRDADETCRRIGIAVATLHGLDRAPLPLRPVSADLDKTAVRVGQLPAGPLRRRLEAWFARIGASTPPEPAAEALVAVHGDCKPAQVLIGTTVGLLDPDHLGTGDPAGDLAQFHVALVQAAARVLVEDGPATAPSSAERLIAAFDAGYATARVGADPGLAERVRWFEQLTLLRKAVRAEARRPGAALATVLADLGGAPA